MSLMSDIGTAVKAKLDLKVNKIAGKGLSTEDYSTAEKSKLAGIAAGAQVNVPTNLSLGTATATVLPLNSSTGNDVNLPSATTTTAGLLSATDKTKLNGLSNYVKPVNEPISYITGLQTALDGKASTTYVDGKFTDLIGAAPAALDTLKEIADQLANDESVVSALTTAVSNKANTTDVNMALATKVDKVAGKQLSTEDYTTTEKTKLAGLSNYTLPTASSSVSGGVKVSATAQTVAANAVTATASRTYAVQLDASGNALVNVPWVDTNTTTTVENVLTSTSTTNALSAAQGKVLQDSKVAANAAITAGTGTKVTYDAKGLVTGSTSLVATDIPVLDASKITTGTLPVLRGGTGVTTSTGTGNVVLSNSPTLVTPVLGVATGTSFNAITGLASVAPLMNSTAAVGTSTLAARQDHIHGSDTTKADLASPALTGVPTAPTAAVGTNTTQIATTEFVNAEIANDTFSKTELTMAIGNINSPLLDMPLKNSLALKAGVGSATYTRASTATYKDITNVRKIAAIDTPRFTKKGYLNEGAATNLALYSDDLTNAAWVKTNGTALKDATGWDDVASSASTFTATAANATVLQTLVSTSTLRTFSIALKRKTGTGIVEITQDNGVTWLDVTTSLSATNWHRATITASVENPVFGVRLTTSGDAVYVDEVQLENDAIATSYIPTTSASVTRAACVLTVTGTGNYGKVSSAKTIIIDVELLGHKATRQTLFDLHDALQFNRMVASQATTNTSGLYYSSGFAVLSATPLAINTKHRLAVVIGDDNATSTISRYLNGMFAYSSTSTLIADGTPVTLYIGKINSTTTQNTFGYITNLRVYDKVLSSQEIALC